MGFFGFELLMTTHRSARVGRQHERASLTLCRALQARNETAMQNVGGGSAAPAPRAPRTQRRTSARKPATGEDGDGDGPAPRSHLRQLFYSVEDVAQVICLSRSGVQEMVRKGEFPKPRALGARRVGWLVSEVEAWAVSRPIADCLPPVNAGMRRAAA